MLVLDELFSVADQIANGIIRHSMFITRKSKSQATSSSTESCLLTCLKYIRNADFLLVACYMIEM